MTITEVMELNTKVSELDAELTNLNLEISSEHLNATIILMTSTDEAKVEYKDKLIKIKELKIKRDAIEKQIEELLSSVE